MAEQFQFEAEDVAVDRVEPDGRTLHIEVGFGKDVRILREAGRDPDGLYVGIEISRKKAGPSDISRCFKFDDRHDTTPASSRSKD